MAAQATLPPGLTADDIHFMFEYLDMQLNTTILWALMHGLYTGVLGVTLWTIFRISTKNTSIGRSIMLVAIFALYILATIALGEVWAFTHRAFIDGGQNCFTVFSELDISSLTPKRESLALGIIACISTFIADSSLIWRCWIVWGRRWFVVTIPVLCTISCTVFKGIETYHNYFNSTDIKNSLNWSCRVIDFAMPYLALTLTVTIWCTSLLLYRIISVVGSGHGVGIRSYRGVIEALVESAALYSAILIIDVAFLARNIFGRVYVDVLGITMKIVIDISSKGISPTLLVGRVAAGHARPDDSWQESSTHAASSLNFGTRSLSTQEFEGDTTTSIELDDTDNIDPGLERNSFHRRRGRRGETIGHCMRVDASAGSCYLTELNNFDAPAPYSWTVNLVGGLVDNIGKLDFEKEKDQDDGVDVYTGVPFDWESYPVGPPRFDSLEASDALDISDTDSAD
ncbi:hypothetical protein EDD85DRAFT_795112 [Armillaria nabsnona]|nr:hypothetical protein EDD85DRAFT_795112 [Armillaria nabsnona]